MSTLAYGEAHHKLPARCWLAPPERVPGYWCRFPQSGYEHLVSTLMGRSVPVAGHPAACTVPGCWHAIVWHAHRTRDHACAVPGCACRKLARADQDGFPWAVTPKAESRREDASSIA